MANISISLQGIDQAVSALRYRPGSPKMKVIEAIRNHYTSDESVKEISAIDTDLLISRIWNLNEDPSKIKAKRRNFSSLRSSISADLEGLVKKGRNPENIILNHSNVFDLTQEAKDDLLGSFANAFKKGEIDIGQAAGLLEVMTEFISNMDQKIQQSDTGSLVDKIKTLLNKLSQSGSLSEDGSGANLSDDGTESGLAEEDSAEIELIDDEEFEEVELEEGEEIEEADADEEIIEQSVEDEDDFEEIELDEDEEFEELDELDEEEIEEIEAAEEESADDEELEEESDQTDDDFEEIELADDEGLEEVELDEDEELEAVEEDEIPEDDPDIEEIEIDEDLEIIDEKVEEEDDFEEIELDEDEELEVVDELDEEEDIEEIEAGEDEWVEDDEPEDDYALTDEAAEEIELDEDEELEEVELDEDEEIEEAGEDVLVEDDDGLLDDDQDLEEIEIDEDEEIVEEEIPDPEIFDEDELEEVELDEDEKLEEIDELDEEELKALEEFRQKKELAEQFDQIIGEREKKYNKYTKVPHGIYTIGTKKGLKSSLDLQPFEMPEVYIGIYPVTNALFEIFIEETGYVTTAEKTGYGTVYSSRFKKDSSGSRWNKHSGSTDVQGACWYQPEGPGSSIHGKRNHPVVQVSIDDAVTFASWIGRRIPTEAEWEAAARTDLGTEYPWGNTFKPDALNTEKSGFSGTTPVDQYDDFANEFKIIDLLGNVMEWTSDMESPPFKTNKNMKYCVAKGGSWNSRNDISISGRGLFKPGFSSNTIGFRCISEISL